MSCINVLAVHSGLQIPHFCFGTLNLTNSYGGTSFKGNGVGFNRDLGSRTKLVAGFAQVPRKESEEQDIADIRQVFDLGGYNAFEAQVCMNLSDDRNIAIIGLSLSFQAERTKECRKGR